MQIKKESSDLYIYLDLYFIADSKYEHKIFHVFSGQLHLICKYTSIPAIQACNTFQKSWDGGNLGVVMR